MPTSKEIRNNFLEFFKSKNHKVVDSSPVIPYNDPTLLFTNAGMNQFKDIFLGVGKRDYKRCVNSQKCIRVSGKHNDLEEVGYDAYHHTFFEMLGNWSFGDYYKKEAIKWAWELLTEIWKLPKERLWATVLYNDDEALELWKSQTDINHSHILKFDEKDNFWEMGETGPCGPCSEIHVDLTETGCKPEDVNASNPDVIEIWNLVFIQFNRDDKGVLHDLPQKHVDTGMGFERIVRILQNKKSNYETDIFTPLLNELINISKLEYSGLYITPMNVIADHVRTLSVAIADGALPSNEGRGYVLRRILRRAARYGRKLNLKEPFIYKLVDPLSENMGYQFKELIEKKDYIKNVIMHEEENFNETLDRGLIFFNNEITKIKDRKTKLFSGESAFMLHDTYGFPIDLTMLLAKENGLEIDTKEFDKYMKLQKERSRASRKENIIQTAMHEAKDINVNYDPYNVNAEGIRTTIIIPDDIKVTQKDDVYPVFLKDNPFYSESGGQVSDKGMIILEGGNELEVVDSKKDYILVKNLTVDPGRISGLAKVDLSRRRNIEKNHTATHIVHEALRQVLGTHVKQMGSYLDDNMLRFDFPHFQKVTDDQILNIEEIVNGKIKEGIDVFAEVMPINKAEKIPNVKKFFGEKYGDNVRVVFIDEKFSVEFCGGTHVLKTKDIGLFKITKEEGISSGVRRIFARTGEGILRYMNERLDIIENLLISIPEKYIKNYNAGLIDYRKDFSKADLSDPQAIRELLKYQESVISSLNEVKDKYVQDRKELEKQGQKEKAKHEAEKLSSILKEIEIVNDVKVLKKKFDVDNIELLKELADQIRLGNPDLLSLIYFIDDKVNAVISAGDILLKEKNIDCGKLAKEFSKMIGGGGGGRKHLAAAGGKNIDNLQTALNEFNNLIK